MTVFRELRIGEQALLVSFMRIKTGKEFDVAQHLYSRRAEKKASYYTCYGQYDLVELLNVNSHEAIYDVPFDDDIIDSEFSLFYSWDKLTSELTEWAKGYPVLVLCLLKIQPKLEEDFALHVETDIINYIKKSFGNESNIFASLGRSEFLLFLRGNDFETVLSKVSNLRQNVTIKDVIEDTKYFECCPHKPIFIDTTTFPLVIHPLLDDTNYQKLSGNVLPRVNIICNPGYEKIIAKYKIPSCAGVYNVYGNYDITMVWSKPLSLSEFAKELTDIRSNPYVVYGIKSTNTVFLDVKELSVDPEYKNEIEEDFNPEAIPGTDALIKNMSTLNPMVKSRLIEFLGRLNSYYMQEDTRDSFEDMARIYGAISWGLEELKHAPTHEISIHNNFISEIIDLCNNGLFQRYEGLETHFETCKHLPFPFLRGINGLIAAGTAIPSFIFKSIFPKQTINQTWSGFVVFGLSHSYQLFSGKILSYPASSLYKPIEDWWGITHEIAHALYRMDEFYEDVLPDDIKQHLRKLETFQSSHYVDVEEIYSNWFDFVYIFEKNQNRYFPMIWQSWLRWERVWRYRDAYLVRSFLIYLTIDIDSYKKLHHVGIKELREYTNGKYSEMIGLLSRTVPEFTKFNDGMSQEKIDAIPDIAFVMEALLYFLQYTYFDKDIYDRLNPKYPDEVLDKHVSMINQGLIVTDDLPSPIKFLHKLHDVYATKPVPLKATAATVLTLSLNYIRRHRR